MRFLRFEIENFKGIKSAVLDFSKVPNASVFTLVGLNESGKTTVLEAINTFSPEKNGVEALYQDAVKNIQLEDLVPKNRKANFTGNIQVRALVEVDERSRQRIQQFCRRDLAAEVDIQKIPTVLKVANTHKFSDSRHVTSETMWDIDFYLKKGKSQSFKKATSDDWDKITGFISEEVMPQICYFPTFLFSFPERIYLSNPPDEKDESVNAYYVQIVQDVLDSIGENLSIETHIVERVKRTIKPNSIWNPLSFFKTDEREQIDHVMLKIGTQVTRVIFSRWNDIFGVKIQNKSIDVDWNIETDPEDQDNPSVYLKFFIRDGDAKYDISERSLGFRWFFCFLLFTQFRASRPNSSAFFLFDEPASNLHSRAQEQLLQSFSNISVGDNMTLYSTHSHYMIEPKWLEGAFIVANDAVNYDSDFGTESHKASNETNIHVQKYREFVGKNPDRFSYFQPILDKLDYAPAKLELGKSGVFLEGKNDFYMLGYFSEVIFRNEFPIYFVPSSGANDLGPLISLYLGWGQKFFVLLDDDQAGRSAKERYRDEWLLPDELVNTIGQIVPTLKGKKLEHILSAHDRSLITDHQKSTSLTKKEIARFFQEVFARREVVNFDSQTLGNVRLLLESALKGLSK